MSESNFRPPENLKNLGFRPQKMVRWFNPVQLIVTCLKVRASSKYTDNRLTQAALGEHSEPGNYHEKSEIWFDYVADLGDGWNSTYSIAYSIAQSALDVESESGEDKLSLPRGQILIMGGDEIYPTASRDGYRNRTAGPYETALPAAGRREARESIGRNRPYN